MFKFELFKNGLREKSLSFCVKFIDFISDNNIQVQGAKADTIWHTFLVCHVKVVSIWNFQIDTPELMGNSIKVIYPLKLWKKKREKIAFVYTLTYLRLSGTFLILKGKLKLGLFYISNKK